MASVYDLLYRACWCATLSGGWVLTTRCSTSTLQISTPQWDKAESLQWTCITNQTCACIWSCDVMRCVRGSLGVSWHSSSVSQSCIPALCSGSCLPHCLKQALLRTLFQSISPKVTIYRNDQRFTMLIEYIRWNLKICPSFFGSLN